MYLSKYWSFFSQIGYVVAETILYKKKGMLILATASWSKLAIKGGMSFFHILRVFSMGHDFFPNLEHCNLLWAIPPLFLLDFPRAFSMLYLRKFSTRAYHLFFNQMLGYLYFNRELRYENLNFRLRVISIGNILAIGNILGKWKMCQVQGHRSPFVPSRNDINCCVLVDIYIPILSWATKEKLLPKRLMTNICHWKGS